MPGDSSTAGPGPAGRSLGHLTSLVMLIRISRTHEASYSYVTSHLATLNIMVSNRAKKW